MIPLMHGVGFSFRHPIAMPRTLNTGVAALDASGRKYTYSPGYCHLLADFANYRTYPPAGSVNTFDFTR